MAEGTDGFMASVSEEELRRRGSSEQVFEDFGVFEGIVVDLASRYRREPFFDGYAMLNRFLDHLDRDPGIRKLQGSQKCFARLAAEVYFYSRTLGVGPEFISESIKGEPLSGTGIDFLAKVLYGLYEPSNVPALSENVVNTIRRSYENYRNENFC